MPASSPSCSFPLSSRDPKARTVLLIDDDDALREILAEALVMAGYHVLVAADGYSGVKLARTTALDIVVTDLIMPVQEGIETIITLHRERPSLPIIAISGGVENSALYLAIAAKIGARRVLPKPFTAKRLIALIEVVLAETEVTA